jgi:hypothetical protein
MNTKTSHLKLVDKKIEIFDAPAFYKFMMVDNIKVETVSSFLNRGGTINYIGTFSDPFHPTNYPSQVMVNSQLSTSVVSDNKAS